MSLRSSKMLVLGTLLGLTVTLTGCSKNDDNNDCRDLFTSSCLLSQQQLQNSSGNGAALAQINATTGDGASAKVATLSSTADEVTTQATDSDEDSLVYKILDRLPGSVDVNSDGTYTYTPSAAERLAAAGVLDDTFSVTVSDRDEDFHLHGLRGLLGQFPNRDRLPITVPIGDPD